MRKQRSIHILWLPVTVAMILLSLLFSACSSSAPSAPPANLPANEGSAADTAQNSAQSVAVPAQPVDEEAAEPPAAARPQSPAAFSGEVDGFRYEIRDLQVVSALDDKKIIGNVTNVGDQMFMFTRYNADFYDAGGSIVASAGPVRVSSDIHPVGMTLPIWFYVDDNIAWDHYEIYVSDRGAGLGGVQAELLDLTVEPTGSQSKPCTGYTVTNNDDKIASWVFVIGRYYGQDGSIAGAWSSGISTKFLEARATSERIPCVHDNYPYDIQVIGYHQPNRHE